MIKNYPLRKAWLNRKHGGFVRLSVTLLRFHHRYSHLNQGGKVRAMEGEDPWQSFHFKTTMSSLQVFIHVHYSLTDKVVLTINIVSCDDARK
jgi:hypothetical protein